MRDRPAEMAESELVGALSTGWGLDVPEVTYRPVGAGSYHWSVVDDVDRRWFVTVDDLGVESARRDAVFVDLTRALDTALALRRDAGLEPVVAPVPTRTGASAYRLGARYAVSVFPLLDGVAGEFGPHRPADLPEVLALLGAVHRATPVVARTAGRFVPDLPGRQRLTAALDDLDRQWAAGPYAEPTRKLLTVHAGRVAEWLADFDRLAARVAASGVEPVVTHGEPHPGNLLRTADGLRLIDWETVRVAPPERDLWLVTDDPDLLAEYSRATGHPVDPAGLAFHQLRWRLADVAEYVDELRRPHGESADSAASWSYLTSYFD
ncbi:aminoglycoside phosphotransferase family protein [Plantactinospora sonchi]|uniref:Aminoglycoside phosphotransferase family protein n=1 Tax=Plantactinospora sonchi TaxID=1544735 RepID=A0ABU7RYH0_9ACTN